MRPCLPYPMRPCLPYSTWPCLPYPTWPCLSRTLPGHASPYIAVITLIPPAPQSDRYLTLIQCWETPHLGQVTEQGYPILVLSDVPMPHATDGRKARTILGYPCTGPVISVYRDIPTCPCCTPLLHTPDADGAVWGAVTGSRIGGRVPRTGHL